jgi:hypothetical protein
LEREGFEIIAVYTNPMDLLKISRVIEDEGFFRSLKIGCNFLTHRYERGRILEMRRAFNKYKKYLNAISIIARKK